MPGALPSWTGVIWAGRAGHVRGASVAPVRPQHGPQPQLNHWNHRGPWTWALTGSLQHHGPSKRLHVGFEGEMLLFQK